MSPTSEAPSFKVRELLRAHRQRHSLAQLLLAVKMALLADVKGVFSASLLLPLLYGN